LSIELQVIKFTNCKAGYIHKIGLQKFAAQAGINPSNLYKALTGEKAPQTPINIEENRRLKN
jgi:predicted transcriptional regulator